MAGSEIALPRSQMTTGMHAGMTFMKFARGQMLKPEVKPFTWGIITTWALLMPLGFAGKEARLTSTYHTPPKH